MPRYETPGIYYERTDASAGGIAALRTDVTGFVGIAQRGPIGIAVPLDSARQFEAWFGLPIDNGYLAYCARAYFENGGRRMWAVRVGSAAISAARLVVNDSAGPAWSIEASSPGAWGNNISVRLTEVRRAQVRARVDATDLSVLHTNVTSDFRAKSLVECRAPTVEQAVIESVDAVGGSLRLERALTRISTSAVIRVETLAYSIEVFDAGKLVALYADLSLVPEHPRYGPALLKQPWQSMPALLPDGARPRASDIDLALEYFRVARNRVVLVPPPIIIRELRDQSARDALNPLIEIGVAGAQPVKVGGAQPAPRIPLSGGANGLEALTSRDFTGEAAWPGASNDTLAAARRGIAALEPVDEIALLAVPDIHIQPRAQHLHLPPPTCEVDPCLPPPPPMTSKESRSVGDRPPRFALHQIYQVQAAMVAQAERKHDRIALLDAPFDTCNRLTFAESELRAWRSRFDSPFATLYAPWLKVVDPLRGSTATTRPVPPSGHVAGQYAAIDLRKGVHVAPANVPLNWTQDTTLAFDEARHGLLNTLGVNVIRAQAGQGLRVLGARTLSSDSDWRFVNVRRLLLMIEKSIDISIQWAVFEPNNWRTRSKLALVIGSFLRELWSRGAMVGSTEQEAFYVRCDETNNPPDMRTQGRLAIDVGIAPSVPFEFVVLRIGRDANGFGITTGEPVTAAN